MSETAIIVAKRRGPLHGLSLPKQADFSITQAPDAARFILRGDSASVAAFGPAVPNNFEPEYAGIKADGPVHVGDDYGCVVNSAYVVLCAAK